jgi:hypothetical protein
MTAETQEVPIAEIQWEEVKPAPKPVTLPAPQGKHHRPEASETSIDDETPEDIKETPREAPKPRLGARARAISAPAAKAGPKTSTPKISAPNFSEWHEFFGEFAIKWITRAWIAFVFRGIDRFELLSAMDNAALELDPQAQSDIAKPIAHLADRSKFGKKYGRLLIDSTDGVAAMIQLTMWANRVNRIAKKYRGTERHEYDNVVPGEVIDSDISSESRTDVPRETFVTNPGFSSNGHGYN